MSLSVNPLLMLLVLVIFLTSAYLLNRWLFKPLLTFMDNRSISIKSDLQNIQSNSSEVASLNAEAERVLSQAKAEANLIREKAMESARAVAEQKISAKRDELEKKKREFMVGLEEEGVMLRNSLLSQMPLYRESLKAKLSQL
ncbi:FoF1 ATP synthase subunit B' [Wolinella succinogenes]|uniref:FoF1 ATP synthase subunit B' n=1 Tax=Wolinella succinogenes TaxID=844 RepID=UPI00240A4F0F|nr:FoF1 ATP synthase subunit B' [Wolinella succinogenes]